MSRTKKILRNIAIIALLIFLFSKMTNIYLTPLAAHESSERSIHYGPSEVVHIEDFDGGKYILGKYDKWVSCNTVNRVLFIFWRFGNQPTGFENDKTKDISYTRGASDQNHRVYGIINNNAIKKVELTLHNGEVLTQTEFYDDLFLFTWNANDNNWKYIRGYDSENNIIFEEDLP